MAKRLAGKTLTYDVTDERYIETEIYMSENPEDTVELRIVDGEESPFEPDEINDGSGPWKRIIRPKEDEPTRGDDPFVLDERHQKREKSEREAKEPKSPRTRRATKVIGEQGQQTTKECWLHAEAEVVEGEPMLRIPARIALLARKAGGKVEIRVNVAGDDSGPDASSTLDGLPTIDRE